VNGETLVTCTMIVTQANSLVSSIHDRMPVLFDEEGIEDFLAGKGGIELLVPAAEDALRMWPVSRRVSEPGNGDDPSLIEPVVLHPAAGATLPLRLNYSGQSPPRADLPASMERRQPAGLPLLAQYLGEREEMLLSAAIHLLECAQEPQRPGRLRNSRPWLIFS